MGFKYKDLAKKTKRATLDLGDGDTIAFEFRTGMVTPRFLADIQTLDDVEHLTPDVVLAISEHVARLLTTWDVEDDDGSMFPLDPTRLAADIAAQVQLAILFTCIAEMKPGEATAPEQAQPEQARA